MEVRPVEAKAPPPWSKIKAGVVLYEGEFVTHKGVEWQCIETHKKTASHAPRDDGLFWIYAPPGCNHQITTTKED